MHINQWRQIRRYFRSQIVVTNDAYVRYPAIKGKHARMRYQAIMG